MATPFQKAHKQYVFNRKSVTLFRFVIKLKNAIDSLL